jgi:peptidoglycan/xylan/chitin deacetylase (PgdA/CDA1 family)
VVVALALVVLLTSIADAAMAPSTVVPNEPQTNQDVVNALRGSVPVAARVTHVVRPTSRPRPQAHPTGHSSRSGSIRVVSRGPHTEKVIALTFDDGWDADRCRSIENTLLDKNVTATWFPNAIYVRNAPDLWRDIASHFPIANHTRSHPDLTHLSSSAIRNQIRSDEKIIESITGRQMIKALRPPYGAYNSTVVSVAKSLGYRALVLWNVDDKDTQGATAREALADAERGGRGSIVLMHCGPEVTPSILPFVIDYYRSRGYRFVTIPTLLGW